MEKHIAGTTVATYWNATATQIILKEKDDIATLCPTKSYPN